MDFIYAFALFTAIYLSIGVIYFLFDKLSLNKNTDQFGDYDALKSRIVEFSYDMKNPDASVYKAKYGIDAPVELIEYFSKAPFESLYSGYWVSENATDKDDGWFVSEIYPLNRNNIEIERWPGTEQFYRLGGSGDGNEYLTDPRNVNSLVYIYDHGTKEISETGMRLSEFLSLDNFYIEEDGMDCAPLDESWLSSNKSALIGLWFVFVAFPMIFYTLKECGIHG